MKRNLRPAVFRRGLSRGRNRGFFPLGRLRSWHILPLGSRGWGGSGSPFGLLGGWLDGGLSMSVMIARAVLERVSKGGGKIAKPVK